MALHFCSRSTLTSSIVAAVISLLVPAVLVIFMVSWVAGGARAYNGLLTPHRYNCQHTPHRYNCQLTPHRYNCQLTPHRYNCQLTLHRYNCQLTPHRCNCQLTPHRCNCQLTPHRYNWLLTPHRYNGKCLVLCPQSSLLVWRRHHILQQSTYPHCLVQFSLVSPVIFVVSWVEGVIRCLLVCTV